MTVSDFLVFLVGGGGVLWISQLFEKWTWYQAQSSDMKKYIFAGVCLVISLGAFAVLTYVPKEFLESLTPWFTVAASILTYVFGGTAFHKITKD